MARHFVVRSPEQGLAVINDPAITANFSRALRWRPQARTAVLLPCAGTKPFPDAPSHGGYLSALENKDVDLWVVSEPLGVVPYAWSRTWPNANYDFPPRFLRGAAWDAMVERVGRWLDVVGPKYGKVFMALPGHHERLVREALEEHDPGNVRDATHSRCLASGSCPPGHGRSTSTRYRGFLRSAVRNPSETVTLTARRMEPRGGHHPEAEQRGSEVWIYPKFFAFDDEQIRRFVLFHEVGHWFRQEHVQIDEIVGWAPGEGFFDVFGTKNFEEGFAEAFAVYFTDSEELGRRYPRLLARIVGWVSPSWEAAVRAWVDGAMSELGGATRNPPMPARAKTRISALTKQQRERMRSEFGLAKPTYVGGGHSAVVWRAGPGGKTVFKLTTDADDAFLAEKVRRTGDKYSDILARVIWVGRTGAWDPDPASFKPSLEGLDDASLYWAGLLPVYAIIMERLYELSQTSAKRVDELQVAGIAGGFHLAGLEGSVEHAKFERLAEVQRKLKVDLTGDAHWENWGLRTTRDPSSMVLLDFGYSGAREVDLPLLNPPTWLFSYGSNDPDQLSERLGHDVNGGLAASLPGWQRVFRGWSERWGGGVASLERAAGARTYGWIAPVSKKDLTELDVYEGVASGHYRRVNLKVDVEGRQVPAVAYVSMSREFNAPSRKYLRACAKTVGPFWSEDGREVMPDDFPIR